MVEGRLNMGAEGVLREGKGEWMETMKDGHKGIKRNRGKRDEEWRFVEIEK